MPNDATIPGWAAALLIGALLLCLFVGPRLLALAWRTRRWPEFALGFFATSVAVGNIGQVAGHRLGEDSLLMAAANLLTVLGSMAFYVATWRVYRAGSTVAAAVAALGGAALLAGWAGRVWIDGGFLPLTDPSASNLGLLLARSGPFAWWAAESFRYARRARRQEELGLAAPGTAARFALWGVMGAAGLAALATLLVLALLGTTPQELPVAWLIVALGIAVAAGAGYTSLLWPELYGAARAPEGERA